jgi:hypothetical protein
MTIALPPYMIGEIRSIIRNRNLSPRGVDVNFFNETADETNVSKATPENINSCADEFLKDVLGRARTLTEYCRRLTTVPGDVAKALDSFARSANEMHTCDIANDMVMDDTNNIEEMVTNNPVEIVTNLNVNVKDVEKLRAGMIQLQARVRGGHVRDHQITCADHQMQSTYDDNDEEAYIDSEVYDEQNTLHSGFDELYPPIETVNVTDEQFKAHVVQPFLDSRYFMEFGNGVPCAQGHVACDCDDRSEDQDMVIVGMLKGALFAYLAAKLS